MTQDVWGAFAIAVVLIVLLAYFNYRELGAIWGHQTGERWVWHDRSVSVGGLAGIYALLLLFIARLADNAYYLVPVVLLVLFRVVDLYWRKGVELWTE